MSRRKPCVICQRELAHPDPVWKDWDKRRRIELDGGPRSNVQSTLSVEAFQVPVALHDEGWWQEMSPVWLDLDGAARHPWRTFGELRGRRGAR